MAPIDRIGARGSCGAVVVAAVLALSVLFAAEPAGAVEDKGALEVTLVINAAGNDVVTITDEGYDADDELAAQIATHLGLADDRRRIGSDINGTVIHVDGKLAHIVGERFIVPVNTGPVQVTAADRGYSALAFAICAPRVRTESHTVQSPSAGGYGPVLSRCRGWYLDVDEAAVTGDITLLPDRGRYPGAMVSALFIGGLIAGVFGLGCWLLRRRALRERTWVSWLLGMGTITLVGSIGWLAMTLALFISGAASDPVLIGGGSTGEQMARTLIPGLGFVLVGAVPAFLLLTVPARSKAVRAARADPVQPAFTADGWWHVSWWPAWAQQQARPQAPRTTPSAPYRADDDAPR